MLELTLVDDTSTSSSNYFDFVEQKIEEGRPAHRTHLCNSAKSDKDAFVVQVMDEQTSRQLRLQYFNGHAFPE